MSTITEVPTKKLACFSTVLLLLTYAVAAIVDDTAVIREKYFSLILPAGFRIQKATPVEDFEIYTVTDGSVPYVEIYVGNAPDYPRIKHTDNGDSLSFGTPTVRLNSKWDNDGTIALEFLAVRLISFEWPRYIHGWTTEGAADKRVAQRILLSLTVTE